MSNLDKTRETQAGDFLASVSHELRTPLNSVLGMLELAMGGPLSAEQREYLTSALRSARVLATSLEELCDLAYIESDGFHMEHATVELPAVVWRSVRSLRLPARERGVTLTVKIDPETPQRVAGDAWRLQQLVTGLAQHAIQIATSTQLYVELSSVAVHGDEVEYLLAVHEEPTSSKVSPARGTHFNPSRYSTASLALMIARRLAERLDGHLWIDSADSLDAAHVSCVFKLSLADSVESEPAEATYASGYGVSLDEAPASLEPIDRPLRVLVVDDTPANRQVVKAILEKRGHHVEMAANGRQAVDRVRQQTFDVVLMDAQMPTMNGLEATEAIRRLPNPEQAKLPIIAMTAHALRDDRLRCLAAGMDDYLAKPVAVHDLLEHVERLGRQRQPAGATVHEEPSPADSAAVMLRRFGNDRSLLVVLIGLFRDGLPELQTELNAGLAAGDAETVGRAAHNLRGVAANFDDAEVMAALKQIETLARSGDLAAIGPLVAPMEASLAALVARLERVSEHLSATEGS